MSSKVKTISDFDGETVRLSFVLPTTKNAEFVTFSQAQRASIPVLLRAGIEAFCSQALQDHEGFRREPMGVKTSQITIQLDVDLAERFENKCKAHGYKKSTAVRQIIDSILSGQKVTP